MPVHCLLSSISFIPTQQTRDMMLYLQSHNERRTLFSSTTPFAPHVFCPSVIIIIIIGALKQHMTRAGAAPLTDF